jgi:hypothetical protein
MSETGKEDSTNIYDETRKEMREKQQAEIERQQKTCGELFNRPTDKTLDRLRGKNNE